MHRLPPALSVQILARWVANRASARFLAIRHQTNGLQKALISFQQVLNGFLKALFNFQQVTNGPLITLINIQPVMNGFSLSLGNIRHPSNTQRPPEPSSKGVQRCFSKAPAAIRWAPTASESAYTRHRQVVRAKRAQPSPNKKGGCSEEQPPAIV